MDKKVLFEGIEIKIIELIGNAKFSIIMAVSWLTNSKIIDAIKDATIKGLLVEVIIDQNKDNSALFPKYEEISMYGAFFGYIPNKMMHNKYAIFDNRILITGSYNFSNNAENNFENIIIDSDFNLIDKYLENFKKLKNESEPINQIQILSHEIKTKKQVKYKHINNYLNLAKYSVSIDEQHIRYVYLSEEWVEYNAIEYNFETDQYLFENDEICKMYEIVLDEIEPFLYKANFPFDFEKFLLESKTEIEFPEDWYTYIYNNSFSCIKETELFIYLYSNLYWGINFPRQKGDLIFNGQSEQSFYSEAVYKFLNSKLSEDSILKSIQELNTLPIYLDFLSGLFTKIDEDDQLELEEDLYNMFETITTSILTKNIKNILFKFHPYEFCISKFTSMVYNNGEDKKYLDEDFTLFEKFSNKLKKFDGNLFGYLLKNGISIIFDMGLKEEDNYQIEHFNSIFYEENRYNIELNKNGFFTCNLNNLSKI
jgi:hypothetical protein